MASDAQQILQSAQRVREARQIIQNSINGRDSRQTPHLTKAISLLVFALRDSPELALVEDVWRDLVLAARAQAAAFLSTNRLHDATKLLSVCSDALGAVAREEIRDIQESPSEDSISIISGLQACRLGLAQALASLYGSQEETEDMALIICREAEGFHTTFQDVLSDFHATYDKLKSKLVPRWHFLMLNDVQRNEAYHQAIAAAVKSHLRGSSQTEGSGEGPVCLDIGAGTGLLSMMAAQEGARTIFACEESKVMASICLQVLQKNQMMDNVKIIPKNSKLLVPGLDLPKDGVDLIFTETVDCGLLGEGLLSTLRDASRLLKPGGQMIPRRATLFFKCIQMSARLKARVEAMLTPARAGVDAQWRILADTAYLCEWADWATGVELTHEVEAQSIDFAKIASQETDLSSLTSVAATSSGLLDAIVVWYELELFPGIRLQNSDRIHGGKKEDGDRTYISSHWQQAVFPVHQPFRVSAGHNVQVAISALDNRLQVTARSETLHLEKPSTGLERLLRAGETEVAKCNNQTALRAYRDSLSFLLTRSSILNGTNLLVLGDGMGMEWRLAEDNPSISSVMLLGDYPPNTQRMMNGLAQAFAINLNFIQSLSETCQASNKLLVVLPELVDYAGRLRSNVFRDVAVLLGSSKNAVSLVKTIKVVAQCVHSQELVNLNHLQFSQLGTYTFHLGGLDEMKVHVIPEIDLEQVSCDYLSRPVTACTVEMATLNPRDHGLLSQKQVSVEMTSEGIVTHILFWYEMTLQGDITLSTGARNADNHWRVGAVAVPGPGQLVKKHGSYSVQATFSEQCVDLAFV